jgi:hypothetical protein
MGGFFDIERSGGCQPKYRQAVGINRQPQELRWCHRHDPSVEVEGSPGVKEKVSSAAPEPVPVVMKLTHAVPAIR